MTARAYALMTGLFILFLTAAIIVAAYWIGGMHTSRRTYIVVAEQSIMGLHAQSTVYYRGVPVGTVSAIGFAPHDVRKTFVTIAIDSSIPITANTYADLNTQGVTGLATLELDDSGPGHKPLATSESQPARIPLRNAGFTGLRSAGMKLIGKLNKVADALQHVLSDNNQARITRILANTETLTERLGGLEKRLDASLAGLPALTEDARGTLHRINTLTTHLARLTDSLHGLSDRMQGFAAVGQTAGAELAHQTLPKLGTTLDDLQRTAKALESLSRSLERNPQQLLFGPSAKQPGPGEPGFKGPPH